jgi:hypothetical protein
LTKKQALSTTCDNPESDPQNSHKTTPILCVYQTPDHHSPNPQNGQEAQNYHTPKKRRKELAKTNPTSDILKHSSHTPLISDIKHFDQ